MEVGGTFVLDFHVWWVDCKLWVLLVVWGDQIRVSAMSEGTLAWKQKKLEVMLRIALEGPYENFASYH